MKNEREQKFRQSFEAFREKEEKQNFGWNNLPAVHPRYHASYASIYEEKEQKDSTLGIRMFLCVMLLAAFLALDQGEIEIPGLNSRMIIRQIQKPAPVFTMKEFDLSDVL
nr:hypothetical protein [uncultured Sellimonas sp.]